MPPDGSVAVLTAQFVDLQRQLSGLDGDLKRIEGKLDNITDRQTATGNRVTVLETWRKYRDESLKDEASARRWMVGTVVTLIVAVATIALTIVGLAMSHVP